MKKTRYIQSPLSREDAIAEARRYLKNARECLNKTRVMYSKYYEDAKYVKEASAMAYLAATTSINGYLLGKGIKSDELPDSIKAYSNAIHRHIPKNGKLMGALTIAYQNLHIFGYYRGGVGVQMIKEGFQNVEDIIRMLEK